VPSFADSIRIGDVRDTATDDLTAMLRAARGIAVELAPPLKRRRVTRLPGFTNSFWNPGPVLAFSKFLVPLFWTSCKILWVGWFAFDGACGNAGP